VFERISLRDDQVEQQFRVVTALYHVTYFFLGANSSVKEKDLSATPLVAKADEDLVEIWPLHLINLDDGEHFDLAYKLLSRVPAVIHHYLTGIVLPFRLCPPHSQH